MSLPPANMNAPSPTVRAVLDVVLGLPPELEIAAVNVKGATHGGCLSDRVLAKSSRPPRSFPGGARLSQLPKCRLSGKRPSGSGPTTPAGRGWKTGTGTVDRDSVRWPGPSPVQCQNRTQRPFRSHAPTASKRVSPVSKNPAPCPSRENLRRGPIAIADSDRGAQRNRSRTLRSPDRPCPDRRRRTPSHQL